MTGRRRAAITIVSVIGALCALPAAAGADTFTSAGGSATGNSGNADANNIQVAGLEGTVTKVRVRINSLDHEATDDIDLLVTGPNGQATMLMSDTCGVGLTDATFTFSDTAGGLLPDGNCQSLSGDSVRPTNRVDANADGFAAPAPAGPYQTSLAVFNNTQPNGKWSVFLSDDELNASGGGFNN